MLTWIDSPLEEHKGRAWISCTSAKWALLKALAAFFQWVSKSPWSCLGPLDSSADSSRLAVWPPSCGFQQDLWLIHQISHYHCSNFLFILSNIASQMFVLISWQLFKSRWLLSQLITKSLNLRDTLNIPTRPLTLLLWKKTYWVNKEQSQSLRIQNQPRYRKPLGPILFLLFLVNNNFKQASSWISNDSKQVNI